MTNRQIIGWTALAFSFVTCYVGLSDGFDAGHVNQGAFDTTTESVMFVLAIASVVFAALCLLSDKES